MQTIFAANPKVQNTTYFSWSHMFHLKVLKYQKYLDNNLFWVLSHENGQEKEGR